MSQATGTRSDWLRHDSSRPARERLRSTVAGLTRARRLQVLLDHGFAGLLAGLGLATGAVLAARLLSSSYPPWQFAVAAVVIALAVALAEGWRRRPDALDVAIHADLALKLKQRMSTAWEFMAAQGDRELAERLAAQAVRAGLPTRPGEVFPLRVNRWGRLVLLAATALLLVSVIELNWVHAPVPQEVDEQVVNEGRRLGAFGREMQERAERDALPRSARQGGEIERVGARMESGTLSRGEALEQLRRTGAALDEERQQAQAEASRSDGGSRPAAGKGGARGTSGEGSRAMLERSGSSASPGAGALTARPEDIERSGIPRGGRDGAPGRHLPGGDEVLREALEKLAQIERAGKEDRELGNAREQVRRARENLGESPDANHRGHDPGADIDLGEDEFRDRGARGAVKAGEEARMESERARDARGAGAQGDSSVAAERLSSSFRPDSGQSGPVVKPQGQVREGEVFSSEGRIVPKAGRPGVESVEMKKEFLPQVEGVLANEHYPAHYKAFIRRYFLSLSQGGEGPREQAPSTR